MALVGKAAVTAQPLASGPTGVLANVPACGRRADVLALVALRECWDSLLVSEHEVLHDAERQRARRYRSPDDTARSLVARTLLRRVLGENLRCAPVDVPLITQDDGKVLLAGGAPCDELAFSVTHHADLVAVAVGTTPCGIDAEAAPKRPPTPALLARACTPEEIAYLRRLCPSQQRSEFARLWTRKEALVKAGAIASMADAPRANTLHRARRGPALYGMWRLLDVHLERTGSPFVSLATLGSRDCSAWVLQH